MSTSTVGTEAEPIAVPRKISGASLARNANGAAKENPRTLRTTALPSHATKRQRNGQDKLVGGRRSSGARGTKNYGHPSKQCHWQPNRRNSQQQQQQEGSE